MNIAVAAVFRHHPEDGDTIPASLEEPDPRDPGDTLTRPIIGFMAIGRAGRISWSFIKYEAPEIKWRKPPKMARFSTTRVGHVSCPTCGNSCVYPVWGKPENMQCPACWQRGVSVSYIKENSDEFFEMLGDLRGPLEDAVREVEANPDGAEEFRYPDFLLLGHLAPSTGVLPQLQGKAAERGMTLRLGREATMEELSSPAMNPCPGPYDTGLLIMPGVTSGVLDEDKAREGWCVAEGCVSSSVKLPWLPKDPPKVRAYGGARF